MFEPTPSDTLSITALELRRHLSQLEAERSLALGRASDR